MPNVRLKRAPRYTPVSKRQDKPDAVYWLIRNHPEFSDSDIIKLIGTTKATIAKIRERSHWNAANIKAVDPVTLGLCSQLELDLAVSRVNAKLERAAEARRPQRRVAEDHRRNHRRRRTAGNAGRRRSAKARRAGRVQPVERAGTGLSSR